MSEFINLRDLIYVFEFDHESYDEHEGTMKLVVDNTLDPRSCDDLSYISMDDNAPTYIESMYDEVAADTFDTDEPTCVENSLSNPT
jgi:hypothetical protein